MRNGAVHAEMNIKRKRLFRVIFKPTDVCYHLCLVPMPPGLKLQGSECSHNMLSLSNIITTDLPNTCLTWKHVSGSTGETSVGADLVQLPVYLNQTRVELLFTVDMKTTGEVPSRSFYERGVAFLSSFLTG